MKKLAILFLPMAFAFSLFMNLMPPQAKAGITFLTQTPTGKAWSQIKRNCDNLHNKLPKDGGPRTSAEGQRRVNMMNEMINDYDRAKALFSGATVVTKYQDKERKWYKYMENSMKIQSSNWKKNRQHMQTITKNLIKQGK